MNFDELHNKLFELQDSQYRNFAIKLLPTVDKDTIIGIRTPVLGHFAKKYFHDTNANEFLNNLPHRYFEENSIHALLVTDIKNYDEINFCRILIIGRLAIHSCRKFLQIIPIG